MPDGKLIQGEALGASSTAAVLPGLSTALKAGIVATLYFLYLLAEMVFGDFFGERTYYWHEALVELCIIAALAWASWKAPRPYKVFLRIAVVAMVMLAASAVTYEQDAWKISSADGQILWWELAYALFLFLWIASWAYLVVELSSLRRPSTVTGVVFVVLMTGLAVIYVKFYDPRLGAETQLPQATSTSVGGASAVALGSEEGGQRPRLESTVSIDNAVGAAGSTELTPAHRGAPGPTENLAIKRVHAALELVAVMVGLAAVLLGVPGPLVAMVFGMATLAAFQMAYTSVGENVAAVDPLWMFGLCVFLAAAISIRREDIPEASKSGPALGRSGLSGLLLLVSLGAVLLVVIADQTFTRSGPWLRPFLLAFVVVLVLAMVWITDRFDRAVLYLRTYADELVDNKLRGALWRDESPTLQGILTSTGLGGFLDHLKDSLGRVRDDVVFLGPERIHRPPDQDSDDGRLRCFLVMPFSQEWSDPLHDAIREACRRKSVMPIRGDDLFSPTDIVEDIWQAIHNADFVLADITGRNPNVLYELGIAHTIAKPVLILSQTADDIPIDLATRRVLMYDCSAKDWQQDLRAQVTQAIGEILKQYNLRPEAAQTTWLSDDAGQLPEQ